MINYKRFLTIIFFAPLIGCIIFQPVEGPRDSSSREVSATTSGERKAVESSLTDIDADLLRASFQGRTARVKDILGSDKHKSTVKEHGSIALLLAAVRGHTETVRTLVDAGVDINGKTARGGTALMWAAGSRENPAETVRLLLKAGADANAQTEEGRTALMDAARRGNAPIVQLLLDAGARVNETTEDGTTALTDALSEGHTTIIQLLREVGARE